MIAGVTILTFDNDRIQNILRRGSVVKVSRDRVAANREALLDAAGRLIRQRGVDGVGVAELCNAAGMTHGALYSHFGSKDDLAAEALTQGQSASRKRMAAAIGEAPDLAAVVDFYVSARHRDNSSTCCPMVASASEAARQSGSYRASFANAFRDLSDLIRATLEENDKPKLDDVSLVIAASMIGVVAVARALKTPDHATSDALINASRAMLENLAALPTTSTIGRKKQPRRPQKR
jgi:TetR/AcrR family transcriptional regulator, transcriptional repressor for nem operon